MCFWLSERPLRCDRYAGHTDTEFFFVRSYCSTSITSSCGRTYNILESDGRAGRTFRKLQEERRGFCRREVGGADPRLSVALVCVRCLLCSGCSDAPSQGQGGRPGKGIVSKTPLGIAILPRDDSLIRARIMSCNRRSPFGPFATAFPINTARFCSSGHF